MGRRLGGLRRTQPRWRASVGLPIVSDNERTLVLVKPDGVARGLIGEIVGRIERKGLTIRALGLGPTAHDPAQQHYAEHDGKPFFGELVVFITSGPLVALVAEG